MGKIVRVCNVSLRFKENIIFQEADFEAKQGKIIGVIGPNGSGKSALLKMICGLILPQRGRILVQEEEITRGKFPKDIGILLDSSGLLPGYDGFDNLKSLASIRGLITDTDIRESMKCVGLNPNERKPVKKYSLGMKQKLMLAQAIMERPSLLLLDEPTNGLDVDSIEKIQKLLLKLNSEYNVTIVLASHRKEDVELCDEVYKIQNHKIVLTKS